MFFLIWMSVMPVAMEPLNLEKLGTYQSLELQLFKVDQKFLAIVSEEPQLTLFDKQGTIKAIYKQRGHGPADLHRPRFLGATANRLYILCDAKRLLIFDSQLNFLTSKDSELPPNLNQGMLFGDYLGGEQFLLYAFQNSKNLVHKIVLKGNFRVAQPFYSRELDLQARGTYQWLHRNHHFVADMIPQHSDSYVIEVRKTIQRDQTKEQPVLTELVAPINDFPSRDIREPVMLSDMAVTDQGYIVEFAVVMPRGSSAMPDLNSLDFYWDFYNPQGTNLKREHIGDKRIKPVRNSSEVFVVESHDDDTEMIRPLSLELAVD